MKQPLKDGKPLAAFGAVPAPTSQLPSIWRAKGDELHMLGATVDPQKLLEQVATELETALQCAQEELLSLEQAAEASGYAVDTLRHLVSSGRVPNSGKKRRPLIARRDLPVKPGKSTSDCATYNVTADARRLARL